MTAPMRPVIGDTLAPHVTVHRLWEAPDQPATIRALAPRIRGVATSTLFGRVDAALFDALPQLEIVASFGVGYDNVDVAAAAARGIIVTHTPGVLDDEVADLTVGLLLATIRRIPQADRYLRDGRWPEANFPLSPTLRGRRIGIVGLGRIGKAVARRLAAFDVAIAYHGRSRQPVDYPYFPTIVGLAAACDVLIILAPGGDGTRHLVDAAVLAALGADGILVNVARGSLVDEAALVAALASGTILAAGLDVYADEPRVPADLAALPNTVLLPHIASGSAATRDAMGRLVADNLIAWFKTGRPLTSVPETARLVR
ncbi:2-hydroxyacid dehydrogenase [Polymorphobacter fuscus]|uniref:2-hydroxyacid dehydrogenase n=2 Tax=Sandarakinorhabdus fusca TaxID=1439888 RepID=A0A7C9KY95_9SPHN|nr:2-hydroxyacid dehydrogenase [Polymorphobacter fuscus]KAB7645652.1 2-hydroxyacid dehydrogenase [Polymorphobacter fuscus]MQT18046.1 2-hydroxyacid dehydrogenase [Polymorphobacter fuscus]